MIDKKVIYESTTEDDELNTVICQRVFGNVNVHMKAHRWAHGEHFRYNCQELYFFNLSISMFDFKKSTCTTLVQPLFFSK